jgi:hypothetical protein
MKTTHFKIKPVPKSGRSKSKELFKIDLDLDIDADYFFMPELRTSQNTNIH